jgi:hypothetical protein
MITITEAIYKLYPKVVRTSGAIAYDIDGNEVQYDLAKVQELFDSQNYVVNRAAEYPPITDYLDGVVKGDQDQIDEYIAACLAVKAKYPK